MKFKGRLTYRNFLDYFGNKLEKTEKHAFEKQMMQDAFESEAFDGLSKLDVEDFKKDMTDLDHFLQARTKEKKRRIPIWFPYAASVILLLGLGSVLYYLNQYSVPDEMIGDQMEELTPKIESPIAEPEIVNQDTESVDMMEMLDEDLEMEISDAEAVMEEELLVVSEDKEVEDEIVPLVKSEEVEEIESTVYSVIEEEDSEIATDLSSRDMLGALDKKLEGAEVEKVRRLKSAKKAVANNALQSSRIISGKVVDEEDKPIPGVSIVVKGTANGVVSDLDGQFKLNASDTNEDYRLVASFVGFEPKEVNALADSSLLVVLEMNQDEISEVVVVGYGTSKTERGNTHWHEAKPNQFATVSKFEDYLIENLESKKFKLLQGIHKVKFTFEVEANGALSDIRFKGNPDAVLVKEIERLLLDSGDWYPAESGGKAVSSKVKMILELNFD
ncbi:hypothetical protein BZG02_04755 [Labilibaculum filiforme]|uniref:TonB C-terminal domain-containing protein n=1 Tax=Labilibaculum filiforme TaxID=1940526 RepID=A0A2N3I491_9BACT|nr:carboxypeptidase-like regulatory domain-containing protein [Labilibaculum filiforme]PKQ65140.1 hypothetical protein BZG02_04755 [Labilibaculum filiforme]